MARPPIDILNQRFGRLLAKKFLHIRNHLAIWECICDCGKILPVRGSSLRSGHTTSCGCAVKETAARRCTKEPGFSGFTRLWNGYRLNAKSRRLVFELTKDEFRHIISSRCVYCNMPPSAKSFCYGLMSEASQANSVYIYNGVDRLDNTLGYTIANAVACCSDCNLAKRDQTVEEFLAWVNRLGRHQKLLPDDSDSIIN